MAGISMAGMGNVLYILIMPANEPFLWTPPAAEPSPLIGQVSQAGLSHDRPGEGESGGWRYFGSYALVLFLRGQGQYADANGYACDVTAGDLVTVWPTLGHRYRPGAGGWTQLYLVFEGSAFEMWERSGLLNPRRPVVQLGAIERWQNRMMWVVEGEENGSPDSPLLRVCRMQQLLAEVVEATASSQRDSEPSPPTWLGEAKGLVVESLGEAMDFEAVASALHVSYSTFRRRFAEAVGMPPAKFRAAATIDHARHLMVHTDMSDKQIAAELGFSDPQHFSHRFKRMVGRTPTQFRATLG